MDAQGATSVLQTGRTIAASASGRTYKAFSDIPVLESWVRSVEEYYGANGVRNERFADELETLKVGH